MIFLLPAEEQELSFDCVAHFGSKAMPGFEDLLHRIQKVQVSDTTNDAITYEACIINNSLAGSLINK